MKNLVNTLIVSIRLPEEIENLTINDLINDPNSVVEYHRDKLRNILKVEKIINDNYKISLTISNNQSIYY